MPTRPRRICPRCNRAMPGSMTRCPTCTQRRQAQAPTWRYNDAAWKANRRDYLANNPTCALCGKPSEIPDHHPRSRKQLIADGVVNPDAWQYLRALCSACHRTETAKHQPGGWNTRDD